MTTRRWFPVLLLAGGMLLAQEEGGLLVDEEALRRYSDEEIQRHLDAFDKRCGDKQIPEADVVDTINELKAAYLYLNAVGRLTTEQMRFKEEIPDRMARKGLTARKRPIVNFHCAEALGEMGDPKGVEPLLAWLRGFLSEAHPSPHAVQCGFRSLAWIGPSDRATLDLVLAYATGKHGDAEVAAAAIQGCYEWRELDGETRKRFFDGICAHLEKLAAAQDEAGMKRYDAVEKEGLQALRELGGGKTRFKSPAQGRAWFAKNAKWEPYVGPRFRK